MRHTAVVRDQVPSPPGRSRRRRGIVLGLTGGTAAGKSTLAGWLRRGGAAIYAVDDAAHDLYRPGTPSARAIARMFGSRVMQADGAIDRARLAATVEREPAMLHRLERILHPRLRRVVLAALSRLRRRTPLTVVEAGPLLFALGLHRVCDRALLVQAPRSVRLARLMTSRGWPRRRAAARLRLFAPAERRLARQAAGWARLDRVNGAVPPARMAEHAGRILAWAGL